MIDLPSQRTIRRNIWTALLSASDQEIHDGLSFYPGAHGLCRLLALAHNTTPQHVAGIYAALSPMNGWETNVSNTLDVLRYARRTNLFRAGRSVGISPPELVQVNTSHANRDKAISIALGEDPLSVLKGKKVSAFYRAIASPHDDTHIPIDRHLICLALGISSPTKSQLSRLANSSSLFSRLHDIYLSLGQREGIGNRLASIAWFVQRRLARSNQLPIPHPDSPICCNRPMWHFGRSPKRLYCPVCKSLRSLSLPKFRSDVSKIQIDIPLPYRLFSVDYRGYPRIALPVKNSYANSGRWQYLARFVVMYRTGEVLRKDEHVHHMNGDKLDCRTDNLSVYLAEHHGRYHANHQLLYMLRDRVTGQFLPSQVPKFAEQIHNHLSSRDSHKTVDDLSDIPF